MQRALNKGQGAKVYPYEVEGEDEAATKGTAPAANHDKGHDARNNGPRGGRKQHDMTNETTATLSTCTPTITPNGSGANSLKEQCRASYKAIHAALSVVRESRPHARDYPDAMAYTAARESHAAIEIGMEQSALEFQRLYKRIAIAAKR